MHCFAVACLMSVPCFALGHSIAFGTPGGWWGGLSGAFPNGVTVDSLTGSLAAGRPCPGRALDPGRGMLADGGIFGAVGVKDFAGGIVVHETAGLAALILALAPGPRKHGTTPPHQPGMVMVGAARLWLGWFGFNAGSVLAANGTAAMALVVTHLSAAAAASLTSALVKGVALVIPLRVDAETEYTGLDLSVHGERAYELTS